jgi:histidinol-phosphatase
MLVAEGAAELAVDAPGLAIWDTAAVAVIVAEAGGRFDRHVSSNGLLHDEALELAR